MLVERQDSWQRPLGNSQNVYVPFRYCVSAISPNWAMDVISIMMAGELEIKKMEASGMHEKVENNTTLLVSNKQSMILCIFVYLA